MTSQDYAEAEKAEAIRSKLDFLNTVLEYHEGNNAFPEDLDHVLEALSRAEQAFAIADYDLNLLKKGN